MKDFIVYPAIDLRRGKVVRLQEGDPGRQTVYSDEPAAVARQWIDAGAHWLHVVNLDGAFAEAGQENLTALQQILSHSLPTNRPVQVGGGIRTLQDCGVLLEMGVSRIILGTMVVTNPDLLSEALAKWGAEKVMVSIDARDGLVRTHGWQTSTQISALELACQLARQGLQHLVFTDIARDGLQQGLNLTATIEVARKSHLNVIASGGVRGWDDLEKAAEANLAGAIVGKALYEGVFDVHQLLTYCGGKPC